MVSYSGWQVKKWESRYDASESSCPVEVVEAPWRTARIYHVLESGRQFSAADMLSLQTDVQSEAEQFAAPLDDAGSFIENYANFLLAFGLASERGAVEFC